MVDRSAGVMALDAHAGRGADPFGSHATFSSEVWPPMRRFPVPSSDRKDGRFDWVGSRTGVPASEASMVSATKPWDIESLVAPFTVRVVPGTVLAAAVVAPAATRHAPTVTPTATDSTRPASTVPARLGRYRSSAHRSPPGGGPTLR